jgi:phosphomannomutase
MVKIKFGTDGWRGIIAQDFTFENLTKVAIATAKHYKKHKKIKNGLVIGYDTRFLSKEFAEHVATVIANFGIKVLLSDGYCPTPAVSLAIPKFNCAGGVVITASHNPYKYNGYKLKADFGGPEEVENIAEVEKQANKMPKTEIEKVKKNFEQLKRKGLIELVDLKKLYIDDLKTKIDLDAIRNSGLKIVHDAMYGAGQKILTELIPSAVVIHNEFNPSFGGLNPEPIAKNLGELMKIVPEKKFDVGLATDGDADRIGAVDEKGNFVDPQRVFAILLKYFYEDKGLRGDVVKTVSVGLMVDKLAKKYGLKVYELPVGFKHVATLMVTKDIMIGGEESGGIGVKTHIPERDGLFLGLTICEMMVKREKKLSEIVDEIFAEIGPHYYKRIDLHTTESHKSKILGKLKKGLKEIAGFKVNDVLTIDGYKFFFDGGWLLIRASGTEPLLRFYCEADDPEKVDKILEWAVNLG